jgi:Rrf2 family protein
MKINAKMHYGLKAMIELALNAGEKGLLQKEIAENQCMPNRFMDAVIHDLKVAGLVVNVAGKKSGYKLAKNPENITAYEVYRAFSPDLYIHFCLAGADICPRSEHCASHCFFYDFNLKMESYMKSMTLLLLMQKQKELDSSSLPIPNSATDFRSV